MEGQNITIIMLLDLVLLLSVSGLNYLYFEQILMALKVFMPLKFSWTFGTHQWIIRENKCIITYDDNFYVMQIYHSTEALQKDTSFIKINHLYSINPSAGSSTNTEDPDEMLHNEAVLLST